MWHLLGSLSFCFFQVSCQYYKSSDEGNRTLAIDSCHLARPDITFAARANRVDLKEDVLEKHQKAWIGYENTYEIFRYIGCVRITDINGTIPFTRVNTTNDPGQCYSACTKSKIFGLSKTDWPNCFCFEMDIGSQIQATQNQCDVTCDNGWFTCGSITHLSLYTKAEINKENTDSEQCLAYEKSNNTYVWIRCDKTRHAPCIKVISENTTWERAMDTCYLSKEYPTSNTSMKPTENYWTAYINALIINESEDFQTHKVIKYGFIERDGDAIYLKFTENQNMKMVALCSKETNQHMHSGDKLSTDGTTGVYIAVPLVISMCVCVAVVVVVCYRKRRRQQPEETEHKETLPRQNSMYNHGEDEVSYTNNIDQTTGESMALENNTNISKELRQDKINLKLNSPINSINNEDTRGICDFAQEFRDAVPNMSENSYFVLEKVEKVSDVYSKVGTYVDLSPDRNTIPSDHATNTYNKTADYNRDVDNYDHIGAAKSMTMNEEGHYNTTFSDDKGESFYDTTNMSGPRHAVNDDTYDTTRCQNDYDLANNTWNKT